MQRTRGAWYCWIRAAYTTTMLMPSIKQKICPAAAAAAAAAAAVQARGALAKEEVKLMPPAPLTDNSCLARTEKAVQNEIIGGSFDF